MSATHALFPGTFDPPTLGHLDLVRRAAALFGRVTVALAEHPKKSALFTYEQRLDLLLRCTADLEGVAVSRLQGLLVDGCRELGATVVVRGVRSGTDFDYEVGMAQTNRTLAPDVETVLLVPSPGLAHVSSTLVRQIASMGGDPGALVPQPVAHALRSKFAD